MKLTDIKELLDRLDEQKLEHAYLQSIKPRGWRPTGFRLKTPFGLAHILNVIDREDHTSVVFTIEKEKIEKWLCRAVKQEVELAKKRIMEDLANDSDNEPA